MNRLCTCVNTICMNTCQQEACKGIIYTMYACTYIHIHECIHTYRYICMYTCSYIIHMYACTYLHIHEYCRYIYMYTCVYMCSYIIHIHTYVCICVHVLTHRWQQVTKTLTLLFKWTGDCYTMTRSLTNAVKHTKFNVKLYANGQTSDFHSPLDMLTYGNYCGFFQ